MSTATIGEASAEIGIGQLRIRHRTVVASMEDDFILGVILITRHGLTIDPVREVLRLGNEEFKLNQRCIEARSVRLNGLQLGLENTKRKTWTAPQMERRWCRTA